MMKIFNFLRARTRKWLNEEIWLEDYIKAGLKLGNNVSIQPGVKFDISHCWLIEIGDNVIIAPEAYILAHDTSTKATVGKTRLGKVKVSNNVFVGLRAVVLPNVEIGENSIVAAGSIVTKDVPSNVVVAGNPAKIICTLEEYNRKVEADFYVSPKYDSSFTTLGGITKDMKNKMNIEIRENGYV